jgi:Putative beta-barrel porin-2, OmpL-like. bbp2
VRPSIMKIRWTSVTAAVFALSVMGVVAGADDTPAPAPTAAPSAAPSPAASPETAPSGPGPIEITSFVDTYYSYNFNKPPGDTQLRNFDTKHNQLSFGLLEVALEQKPTASSRLGFRADLDYGPTTDIVHAAEPGGSDIFKTFEQGYLSWLAPVGKGLQFDAGKFVTPAGAEVIETKDNWNYSRSLLFALAIPYYHMGLRATYTINDKVTVAGYLVNGWNNAVDNNSGKSLAFQALLKPHAKLSLVANFLAGPEQTDDSSDKRYLWDGTLTFAATPSLSLMVNYDYGKDRVAGAPVRWQGVAAYVRYQVIPTWTVSPRVEWLDDGDAFMTGASQTLKEFTITSEHKIDGGLLARLEFRRDMSDEPFFRKEDGSLSKGQNTFSLGLVYGFGTRF